jgi:AcrR family transcriptional regulator
MKAEPPLSESPARERFNREAWLREALEVLSREGEGKLRIDTVCKALGVTKGSFYSHFNGREEFIQAMLEYWIAEFNARVPQTTEEHGGSASDRLRFLFDFVTSNDFGRYDVAIDSWAAHEPGIGAQVRDIYAIRFDYVGSLFSELGFKGIELETRTAAFLAFLKSESRVTGRRIEKRTPHRIDTEMRFFLSPSILQTWAAAVYDRYHLQIAHHNTGLEAGFRKPRSARDGSSVSTSMNIYAIVVAFIASVMTSASAAASPSGSSRETVAVRRSCLRRNTQWQHCEIFPTELG